MTSIPHTPLSAAPRWTIVPLLNCSAARIFCYSNFKVSLSFNVAPSWRIEVLTRTFGSKNKEIEERIRYSTSYSRMWRSICSSFAWHLYIIQNSVLKERHECTRVWKRNVCFHLEQEYRPTDVPTRQTVDNGHLRNICALEMAHAKDDTDLVSRLSFDALNVRSQLWRNSYALQVHKCRSLELASFSLRIMIWVHLGKRKTQTPLSHPMAKESNPIMANVRTNFRSYITSIAMINGRNRGIGTRHSKWQDIHRISIGICHTKGNSCDRSSQRERWQIFLLFMTDEQ